VHLAARLRACGFKLLDTQFVTEHLAQFGAIELPRHAYKRLLREAIDASADWQAWPKEAAISGAEAMRHLGTDVPA
jgi:leucyl/phenylalanyl-tRNA---protein transferase